MQKITEMKLSCCGLDVADFRKNCDCRVAVVELRSYISLKRCGIAMAEVLPSRCGVAIADFFFKKLRVPTSAVLTSNKRIGAAMKRADLDGVSVLNIF
jgi:hypothetical protein